MAIIERPSNAVIRGGGAKELSDPSKWKTVKIRELTKRSGFGLIGQRNDTKIIQPIDDRLMLCFPPGMMIDFLQTLVRYHGLESYFQHLGFERLLMGRMESEQLETTVR